MSNAQQTVASNIVARGYRNKPDGTRWTAGQFLIRNVLKLIEETEELARVVLRGSEFLPTNPGKYDQILRSLGGAAMGAKFYFDRDEEVCSYLPLGARRAAMGETSDCQVVLFNIASACGELDCEQWDVVEAAVEKSANDVKRGTR